MPCSPRPRPRPTTGAYWVKCKVIAPRLIPATDALHATCATRYHPYISQSRTVSTPSSPIHAVYLCIHICGPVRPLLQGPAQRPLPRAGRPRPHGRLLPQPAVLGQVSLSLSPPSLSVSVSPSLSLALSRSLCLSVSLSPPSRSLCLSLPSPSLSLSFSLSPPPSLSHTLSHSPSLPLNTSTCCPAPLTSPLRLPAPASFRQE